MERRNFLAKAAIVTAGLASASIRAAAETASSEKQLSNPLLISNSSALKLLPEFAEIAATCALKGEFCIQHCNEQLGGGTKSFLDCDIAAHQMVAICGATSQLAAMKSIRLSEILDTCALACKACKEACEEHKEHWKHGMHLVCKACAEHCDKMLAQISTLKKELAKV